MLIFENKKEHIICTDYGKCAKLKYILNFIKLAF
jgi:hypothetical protein